jgi:hypothetical protein
MPVSLTRKHRTSVNYERSLQENVNAAGALYVNTFE